MSTPRDPRSSDPAGRPDDLDLRLRTSLERHAFDAPDAGMVAERILHTADRSTARPQRRRYVGWGPSLAAALVLFVIGGVVLAVTQLGSTGGSDTAAASADRSSPRVSTSSPTQPAPQVVAPASIAATATGSSGPVPLHDVTLVDLTFDGVDSGWALGSADCVNGPGRCTALLHTSNGRTWQSRPGAQFNVPGVNGCASPCVSHIRFATPQVGYAYGSGPGGFFMTTDGGAHWVQQDPEIGVLALESLDGNVVRVVTSSIGCPAKAAPCAQVQTADIGGTTWTTRALPPSTNPSTNPESLDVSLSRSGSDVYLLFVSQSDGTLSQLYHSGDDGQTWTNLGEPCHQPADGAKNYSTTVAAAPAGRVSVLCAIHQMGGSTTIETSGDYGASFTARGSRGLDGDAGYLAGDPVTVLAAGGDELTYSLDGGNTWTTVAGVNGPVTFVGFESSTVGRALADGGRTIWTTVDAGRTWTRASLG